MAKRAKNAVLRKTRLNLENFFDWNIGSAPFAHITDTGFNQIRVNRTQFQSDMRGLRSDSLAGYTRYIGVREIRE